MFYERVVRLTVWDTIGNIRLDLNIAFPTLFNLVFQRNAEIKKYIETLFIKNYGIVNNSQSSYSSQYRQYPPSV